MQLWPAPGSRTRLPIAAAFFFLLKKRNVVPAGPRQGWARAPSPLHAMGPPLTWPCPPGLRTRGKEEEKPQMPQQPAASRPGAVPHVLLPGVRAGTGAQGGAQAPAGAPLQTASKSYLQKWGVKATLLDRLTLYRSIPHFLWHESVILPFRRIVAHQNALQRVGSA